jgi:hypothetical protein
MNIRKLSLAILAVSAIVPVVASASPEKLALKACAQAFARSISGGSTAPSFKLNYDQSQGATSIPSVHHSFTFTMDAQDRKTGAALASATCSADTHGEVLALTPATAPKVTLAAR